MRYELAGSSGVIGYKPNVDKLFGMPIKLTAGGMSCDLIDTHMVETTHNEIEKHIQTNKSLGVIGSSLEHLVLEQLFATNGEQGFSAVKAMQVANQEGQKIFTITKDNYQEIIPQLNLAPAAIADIESAAKAGYTVTTHQNRISLNGYTGEGYIILDSSGNGAWMINGGRYGGFMAWQFAVNMVWVFFAANKIAGITPHNNLTSFFSGTIFAGLSLASNLLDLASIYDGTAECLASIVFLFSMELLMTFLLLELSLFAGAVLDTLNTILHTLMKDLILPEVVCKKENGE